MKLSTSGFFHESLVPGPWIHMLKYFFENILGYCSRAQVLSIHAKNQSSKNSCYSPFNVVPGIGGAGRFPSVLGPAWCGLNGRLLGVARG